MKKFEERTRKFVELSQLTNPSSAQRAQWQKLRNELYARGLNPQDPQGILDRAIIHDHRLRRTNFRYSNPPLRPTASRTWIAIISSAAWRASRFRKSAPTSARSPIAVLPLLVSTPMNSGPCPSPAPISKMTSTPSWYRSRPQPKIPPRKPRKI